MFRKILFIACCFLLCSGIFIASFFTRTDEALENRTPVEFPSLTVEEDGGKSFNFDFLSELGDWFSDHYAFKPYLVSIDSLIQSKVFASSNVSTVILGKNDWLFYKSTADDFCGVRTMSDREAFNAAHNISILQKYVEKRGATFAFTVAPNKNSLYGENMPYNYKKTDSAKNLDLLTPLLKDEKVNYVDLAELFKSKDEILYLKRDSHWNNKGAVLAENALLDSVMKDHDTHLSGTVKRTKNNVGDLGSMVLPRFPVYDWDYEYESKQSFEFVSESGDVTAGEVETKNETASGTLLMFRDSFGNTLIPLISEAFERAFYTQGIPYFTEKFMDKYEPDVVLAEKVERNVSQFAENPPILSAEKVSIDEKKIVDTDEASATLSVKVSEDDSAYLSVSGTALGSFSDDATFFVGINEKYYEAFCVSDPDSDFSFRLFLKAKAFKKGISSASAVVFDDGHYTRLGTFDSIDIEGGDANE